MCIRSQVNTCYSLCYPSPADSFMQCLLTERERRHLVGGHVDLDECCTLAGTCCSCCEFSSVCTTSDHLVGRDALSRIKSGGPTEPRQWQGCFAPPNSCFDTVHLTFCTDKCATTGTRGGSDQQEIRALRSLTMHTITSFNCCCFPSQDTF